jgi:hypothetical protein
MDLPKLVASCYDQKAEATLAQLVERLIRNQQVAGSIPAGGSILIFLKQKDLAAHDDRYNPGVRPTACSSSAQASRYPRLA